LEDTRRETKESLAGLTPVALDWEPFPGENSIGTLLYHTALIELDWLFTEILENAPWPPEMERLFPAQDRDDSGRLTPIPGATLVDHLARLDAVREHLLASFRGMTVQEFRRPHSFSKYDVTVEWVAHHLIQHEAEHRGHIQMLRSLAERALQSGSPT
jgi:hypothetical protein